MTDHKFFDDFFDDTPKRECTRCKTNKNLHVIGSTGGAMLYICEKCHEKKIAELQEHIAKEQQEIESWPEE